MIYLIYPETTFITLDFSSYRTHPVLETYLLTPQAANEAIVMKFI